MERFGVVGQVRMGVGRRLAEAESSALFFAQRNGFEENKRLLDAVVSGDKEGAEAASRKMFAWSLSLDELRNIFLANPLLRGKVGERLMEMLDSPELVGQKIRQWLLLESGKFANALL